MLDTHYTRDLFFSQPGNYTVFSFVIVVDFLFSLFSVHHLTLLSLSTLFIGYCISWNNALIFMHSYCLSPCLFSERFSQSYFPTLLMNFNSRYWSFVFPVLFRSPLIVYFFLTSCYCFMKTASSFSSFRISTLVFSVRRRWFTFSWCGHYFCFLQFPLVWLFRSFACIGDFHYLVICRSWLDSLCTRWASLGSGQHQCQFPACSILGVWWPSFPLSRLCPFKSRLAAFLLSWHSQKPNGSPRNVTQIRTIRHEGHPRILPVPHA